MRNQKNSLRLHERERARRRFEPLKSGVGIVTAGSGRSSLDEQSDGGYGKYCNDSEEELLEKRKPWSGVSGHS